MWDLVTKCGLRTDGRSGLLSVSIRVHPWLKKKRICHKGHKGHKGRNSAIPPLAFLCDLCVLCGKSFFPVLRETEELKVSVALMDLC
jgi:hypothetical protein